MTARAAPIPFLVTVDAEGDDLWFTPERATTRNAAYVPRFQALCERYGLKVTYLVDYVMARSPAFVELGRDVVARGTGEVGMHLHAWNTPPLASPATARRHPYLTEYAEPVMRDKVHRVASLLEDVFDVAVASHRGGRFAFDERYARILAERGFLVDCSVTPHVDWTRCPGGPAGFGPDYTAFPEAAYWIDLDDVSRPGNSSLLEVPVSIFRRWPTWLRAPRPGCRRDWHKHAASRLFPALDWLYPTYPRWASRRLSFRGAVRQTKKVAAGAPARTHLEFMIHSSELMPGGSPRMRTALNVERLYADMERLFSIARNSFLPMTLTEFRSWFEDRSGPSGRSGA